MARIKKTVLFILGTASVLGAAWLIRQRRADTAGLSDWQRTLARRYGVKKSLQLVADVRQQHAALVNETGMPENAALRWHLTEKILPGLALYRALLQEHAGDQAAALDSVDEAFRAKTLAKSRLLFAPMKVLPNPIRLFKWMIPQVMKQFPPEGWDTTYLEDSADRIAFNMTRCFYMNSLTALGAPELTASFCKSDEVMAECFPPAIRFVRQHTLGRGGDVCDFQYCQVKQP
jgi:hypothetical protein